MGKKSRAKRPLSAPSRTSDEITGLVAFIQQLMQERRFQEALRAGQALVEQHPLNPLAHAVMGSLLLDVQQPVEALRQFEMAQRLGLADDIRIANSIVLASSMLRMPIHALQAARRGLRLSDATAEQRQSFEAMIAETEANVASLIAGRQVTLEQAVEALLLIERSSRALQDGDAERARELAEEATEAAPTWALVWNNLSVLLFGQDDLAGAFAASEGALGAWGADDPLLLSTLVRLYAATGRHAEAEATCGRLLALPDPSVQTREEMAKGVAILDDDRRVYDLLAPLHAEDGGAGLRVVGRYLLGIAAANLGMYDEAREAWRNLAREGLPQVRIFTDMLARQEQPPLPGGRFPYFSSAELVPSTVLDGIAAEVSATPDSVDLTADLTRFPLLPQAVCEALYAPDVDARLAVSILLQLPDPSGVLDAVRAYATSRLPGDYPRVYAHIALRGRAFDDASVPAVVWIGGRRRELLLPALRIVAPIQRSHSDAIAQALAEGAQAQERDDTEAAIAAYQRVLDADPEVAEAEHNLGTALLLSTRIDEGEEHLRRTLELDPEYVLARCNLGSLELTRGNIEAARELLAPLDERISFTLEEVIAYLRTRSDLARAEQDLPLAETLLHALLAFDQENELAKERLEQLAALSLAPR